MIVHGGNCMSWTLLCDGSDSEQAVQTFEEIESVVQQAIRYTQIQHGLPTVVELSLDNESTMGIVVGNEQSAALFMYRPNGPGFTARRRHTSEQEGNGPLIFDQFGSQSEVAPEYTISANEAWEALRLYFATGKRPETLNWGP